MCTVSIIPLPPPAPGESSGFRLVTSRDESIRRAPALPPVLHRLESGQALWPIDADAGGTWVAASDRGLALAILNIYAPGEDWTPRHDPGAAPSRGTIIPRLIGSASASAAAQALGAIDLAPFRPFRLLCADPSGVTECRWERGSLALSPPALYPACFSSHGMGDDTARHRLHLFRRWFGDRPVTPGEQDGFHRHRWASRPEISVRMSRADARTVSITSVTVRVGVGVSMTHEPLAVPGASPTTVALQAPELARSGDHA